MRGLVDRRQLLGGHAGFFLMLLMGVLYIVVGLLFLNRPVTALEALTLLLACSLMVSGAFRIAGSLMHR